MSETWRETRRHRPRSATGRPFTLMPYDEFKERAGGLTVEERRVLLEHDTERPFSGTLLHNEAEGLYRCRLCDLPLFVSDAKYASGTGWPSFYEPVHPDHVRCLPDRSDGMDRTEIRCARCDSHLGHVFLDGPRPTGLRYCMNSVALAFDASEHDAGGEAASEGDEHATSALRNVPEISKGRTP